MYYPDGFGDYPEDEDDFWNPNPNGGFPLSPNILGGLPQPRRRRRIKSDPNSSVIFEPAHRIDDARNRRLEQKNLHGLLSPTADTPSPPEWNTLLKRAIKKQYNRALTEVDQRSREYATIAALLSETHIESVEKIVNPLLWDQFAKKRIEMLKLKSDDLELLTNVGLSKQELKTCYEYIRKFQPHPEVADVPYNDNMALLFHCTNDKKNIDSIVATGLDERIGKGGLLGRGIYFADNPKKSMSYDHCGGVIFIFAVLLGDCISLDQQMFGSLVREPKKHETQKRNNNDLFFDSIVGQPAGHNEYVIYNRHQCYPLYMVNYKPNVVNPASPFGLGGMGIGGVHYGPGGGHYVTSGGHYGTGGGLGIGGLGIGGLGIGNLRIGGLGIGGLGFGGHRRMSLDTGTSLDFPPFCWRLETDSKHMPSFQRMYQDNNRWPFYAKSQFAKME